MFVLASLASVSPSWIITGKYPTSSVKFSDTVHKVVGFEEDFLVAGVAGPNKTIFVFGEHHFPPGGGGPS
jgi:hypothetical protein